MKAIVCMKYGAPEVLKVQEVQRPTPKDNEVLVRVVASAITRADGMMRKGEPRFARLFLGLRRPSKPIPGTGFSGVVESVGSKVRDFQVGDEVFGESGVNFGANAEYLCVSEEGVIAQKPESLSHEEAAPICDGALTAMNFLKNLGQLCAGQKVLINGASGSIGSAAVQLAHQYGAEVTGVCSTRNVEWVKSLGASEVIDYTQEDFAARHQCYDLIFDTIGGRSFSECRPALKADGKYLSPVLTLPLLFQMMWTSMFSRQKTGFSATGLQALPNLRMWLRELIELVEANKFKSFVDRSYRLDEVSEAHRYVDGGHKRGSIVIDFRTANLSSPRASSGAANVLRLAGEPLF